ncbi:TIGR01777 family protein [Candidatus Endobugula sertula]|uniref:TIGR01777 family protein n=1 Tax=Candidatus Endobugula sertula TaxID=62101 RepID=A0A1D2QMF0_9GAMM|nr:TIGR01777 family protein [Candidatus Endobugula sertula]
MNILIIGGTGFIGSHVVNTLLNQQCSIILFCRDFAKARKLFGERVHLVHSFSAIIVAIDAIINLSGEPIIGKRWTSRRKQQLLDSRIGVTHQLVRWIAQQDKKPQVLISGSAIGYYGNYPEDQCLDENAPARDCFPSQLCQQWEFEALKAKALGVRVCLLRTGVVLDKSAGALKKMWLPFKLGLGGTVASGRQWLSWIHIEDMVSIIVFLLYEKSIEGPINATAPEPVVYDTFTRTLAKTLSRPHFFPMPGWLLKWIFGETAQLLIEGQKVIPRVLVTAGFKFQFTDIGTTLKQIANSP